MENKTFEICGTLVEINKRLEHLEMFLSQYNRDMFEVYRNIGVLSR